MQSFRSIVRGSRPMFMHDRDQGTRNAKCAKGALVIGILRADDKHPAFIILCSLESATMKRYGLFISARFDSFFPLIIPLRVQSPSLINSGCGLRLHIQLLYLVSEPRVDPLACAIFRRNHAIFFR